MKFAYQRRGGRILDWSSGVAPKQSRASETAQLGSLGGSSLDEPTLVLPAPGAPEPIGVTGRGALSGCSCHGSCGCGPGMGETETMEQRDARRTLKVVAVWGVAVAALFYFGFKTDGPPWKTP